MGKYLDILDRAETRTGGDTSDISDQRVWPLVSACRGVQPVPTFGRISRFGRTFSELECRGPNHVDPRPLATCRCGRWPLPCPMGRAGRGLGLDRARHLRAA